MRALKLFWIYIIFFSFCVNAQLYVSPSGYGDKSGKDWNRTMDNETFMKIYPQITDPSTPVLLTEGVYRLPAASANEPAPFKSSIIGGFSTSMNERNSSSYPSKLTSALVENQSESVTFRMEAPASCQINLVGVTVESAHPQLVASLNSPGNGAVLSVSNSVIRRAPLGGGMNAVMTDLYGDTIAFGDQNPCKFDPSFLTNRIGSFIAEELLIAKDGRDSIVRHHVEILPQSVASGDPQYYVTVSGAGLRSGSSWRDAMNATDFAYSFGRVKDGSTFHIATGEYFPLYDKDLDVATPDSALFYTQRNVSLVGGYSTKDGLRYSNDHFLGERTLLCRYVERGKSDVTSTAILDYEPLVDGNVIISKISIYGSVAIAEEVARVNSSYELDNMLIGFGNGITLGAVKSLKLDKVSVDGGNCGLALKQPADLYVVNSTFGSALEVNAIRIEASFLGSCTFEKNTILASVCIGDGNYAFIGNIFASPISSTYNTKPTTVTTKHNLYRSETTFALSQTDIREENITPLFNNGSYALSEDRTFSAIAPLVSDSVGGHSIRYPNTGGVTTDQMGKARMNQTCMGACELSRGCEEMTIPTLFDPLGEEGDLFMPDCELYIYDRYGRLLYRSDELRKGWDGKIEGEYANEGVYVYALYDSCGNLRRGTIEIFKQLK